MDSWSIGATNELVSTFICKLHSRISFLLAGLSNEGVRILLLKG
jgi:hypothetical protein